MISCRSRWPFPDPLFPVFKLPRAAIAMRTDSSSSSPSIAAAFFVVTENEDVTRICRLKSNHRYKPECLIAIYGRIDSISVAASIIKLQLYSTYKAHLNLLPYLRK